MKWITKILLTILVLLGSYTIFQQQLSGQLSPEISSKLPNPGDIVARIGNWFSVRSQQTGRTAGMEHSGESRMYRWRDAEGIVHVSDEAPEGIEYETLWIDPNQSLLEQ